MFCSVYSIFIVAAGTLRLPWLRFFRAFSSVVRQMPGYNSQRRGTAHTLPKLIVSFSVLFVCKCVLYYRHRLSTQLQLNISVYISSYVWSTALYGAENWTLPAVDQKHLESFEMWCWRRMEKTSWTDHVRNEDVLLRVKEQRNILHEIRKRKANWIGHILRRNCLLQWVTEGKIQGGIEVTGRQGRRK